MPSSYRAVLARPGARALALACGLGWLSFAAYALALVLAVRAATGSFAAAGAAVSAFSAGSALLAPWRGRTVDRRGPRAVGRFAAVHGLAMALLAVGCATSWPPVALVAAAAVAGACVPPLIATARAVWPGVAGPELTRASHALNAALGDAGQVAGPALTGALAALVAPAAALGAIAATATGAAFLLVAIAPAEPAVAPADAAPRRRGGALAESPGLRAVVGCELLIGVAIGALEVVAPVIAARDGAAELAALPLAAFALGSIAASVWSGAGAVRRPPARRYALGTVAFLLALVPAALAGALPAFTATLVLAGAAYGVLNVAVFELLEDLVAPTRAVEAFTWLTTFAGLGMALGAALAGSLA